MKYLLLIVAFNLSVAQTDVFECARKGTAQEMDVFYNTNPKLVDSINKRGSSPLTLAAYYNNLEVVNYLIDKVDSINGTSKDGTPLMAAVVKGYIEVAKALIDAGANVNLSDANNATALHYAVMFNNKEITTLLVDAKADVNLKNNVGKTPLDFAKMHNDATLNSILEQ
mgnify:FL=1